MQISTVTWSNNTITSKQLQSHQYSNWNQTRKPYGLLSYLLLSSWIIWNWDGESSAVDKLVGDTKLFRMVEARIDCKELQEAISKLGEQIIIRQMYGKWNSVLLSIKSYTLEQIKLTLNAEGAGTSRGWEGKRSWGCSRLFDKNAIRKENKMANTVIPLYRFMVRPHLENCVQFGLPYFYKDITEVGKVQMRATKMFTSWATFLMRKG